jgi:hypothetical protein
VIVPSKGQEEFEKMFGISWKDALASGNVYNAKQACEKLGCDGLGLEKKWGDLNKKTEMLKFGGGFYCGKVDGLFVLNGFYMSMRAAYLMLNGFYIICNIKWFLKFLKFFPGDTVISPVCSCLSCVLLCLPIVRLSCLVIALSNDRVLMVLSCDALDW